MAESVTQEQHERLLAKLKLSTEQRLRLEHEYNTLTKKFDNFQELQQKIQMVLQHRHQNEIESYEAKYKQLENLLEFQLQRSLTTKPTSQNEQEATVIALQTQIEELTQKLYTAQTQEHLYQQQLITEKSKSQHNLDLYLSTQSKLQQLQNNYNHKNVSNEHLLQLIQLQTEIDLQIIQKGHTNTFNPAVMEASMEDNENYTSAVMLYKEIELLKTQHQLDLEDIAKLKSEIEQLSDNVGIINGSIAQSDDTVRINQQYEHEIARHKEEINASTNLINKYVENEQKYKNEIESLKNIITEQRTTLNLLQKQTQDIAQIKINSTTAIANPDSHESNNIIASIEAVNSNTDMHEKYMAQINELKTQVINVTQENNNLIDDIGSCHDVINKMTADHAELEETLMKTLEQHKILTNTANQQIKLVLDAVQTSRKERDEYKQESIDKDHIITTLQIQYNQELSNIKSSHMSSYVKSLQDIQVELQSLQHELLSIRDYMLNIQKQYCGDASTAQANSNILDMVKNVLQQQHSTMEFLRERYDNEHKLRKKIFNQLQELRGNIRVLARVRPLSQREIAATGDATSCVIPAGTDNQLSIRQIVNERVTLTPFEFERVFGPESTQEDVFDEVKDLIVSCLDGYNVCIFAYGQTGSGKTYSMNGYGNQRGVNPRSLEMLFAHTAATKDEFDWSLKLTIVEIYNDKIQDLLRLDPKQNDPLKIAQNKDGSNYIAGVNMVDVTTAQDVEDWFEKGQKNRSVSKTDMNDTSSRSHLILTVYSTSKSKLTGQINTGRLNLIDLAGSERVSRSNVSGDALKEAQAINSSLSCLGNVIAARAANQGHVPYRNSQLTHLLQDSLDKNSKTLMIVQCSPTVESAGETICSLRFAERAAKVELGKAVANKQ